MACRRLTRVAVRAALAVSLGLLSTVRFQASAREPIRIRVIDRPRPVYAAVLQIEERFGWVVTYEDTRYLHPSDIVDVTERVRRDGKMSDRVLGMRNGTIDFTYEPQPGATIDEQVGAILQETVARSRAGGNTGDFRVDWVSGGYHVVPIAMKGKSGAMEPFESPLEARITLPYRQEDALQAMLRIVQAITRTSGITVNRGVMPLSMERTRVALEAHNDPARDVLWRTIQSISPNLSWELLCGARDNGTCHLSIHGVRRNAERGD